MKVGAHPLVVAAAFGLLGPLALAEDDVCAEPTPAPCKGCTCERALPPEPVGAVTLPPTEVEALVGAAWDALVR